MAQASFPIQTFVPAAYSSVSSPDEFVVDGSLIIHLSTDASTGSGQIGSKVKVEVALGALGEVLNNPQFWENSSLTPSDTVYILEVENANGLRICGPIPVTVGPSSSDTGFGVAFGFAFGS